MIEDWLTAISFVLQQEGGYTNDPNDPGGETVFGISRVNNPQWRGWTVVDGFRDRPDFPNVINNDPDLVESATEFYKANYWAPCSCDDLPRILAIPVFDCSVNQGVTKAKRMLQMALGVEVDGDIGAATLAAAAKAADHEVKMFLAFRLAEYVRIIVDNPKLMGFARDWSYRVLALEQLVFKAAA